MKYKIVINQLACHNLGLSKKLDIIDLAILYYIRGWCESSKGHRRIKDNEIYTRINYAYMLVEMPLLGIKGKDTVSKRIQKIRNYNLIKTFQAPDNSLFITLTSLGNSLFKPPRKKTKKKQLCYRKKKDRLYEVEGQALSEKIGQQQTNNYNKPQITTTGTVVVSEIEIKKVRDVLSTMSVSYEGITDRLISDLINEKGFHYVYETARKIARQYQSGYQLVSNPPGHFRSLVKNGMDAPPGYISEQEAQIKRNELDRKINKRKELERMRYEEIPAEAREFIANLCGRNNHG